MFKITPDKSNKDIPQGMSLKEAREYYLDLHKSGRKFKSKLGTPRLQEISNRLVLRCDENSGLKAIAAEKYIRDTKEDVLVYVAPRSGFAAFSVALLAKMYKKKAVFFAPASKEVSEGQACVIAMGAELRFVKIAAMPVLNSYAKAWAEKHGAKFLPFGLSGVPEITAAIVNLADEVIKTPGKFIAREFWCATSTGTMIRGLQIGWPKARPRSIAVARNIQVGEIGKAEVESSELPFLKPCKVQPPFPTTACYDAKAWEPCLTLGKNNSIFINVGADQLITDAASKVNMKIIKSAREWGDMKDLNRGPK